MLNAIQKLGEYRWVTSFVLWQVSALIFIFHRYFTNLVDQAQVNWGAHIASMEALHVAWAIMTIPFFQWLGKQSYHSVVKAISVSVVVAALHSVLTTALFSIALWLVPGHLGFSEDALYMRMLRVLIASPAISWIIAVVLMCAWYGWKSFKQYEAQRLEATQLQNELVNTQLQMLRSQLNPHFLFNAFNTIAMMIRTGRYNEANTMLVKTAELLRASLLANDAALCNVRDEIAFCSHYLDIEAVRFSDRLKISFDLQQECELYVVPGMILQPLVENAFKHGLMDQLDSNPELVIRTKLGSSALLLAVENTGRLVQKPGNAGLGLKNVRRRLALTYPDSATFELFQDQHKVIAQIIIKRDALQTDHSRR